MASGSVDLPWPELDAIRTVRQIGQTLVLLRPVDRSWGLEGVGPLKRWLRRASIEHYGTWMILSTTHFGLDPDALARDIDRLYKNLQRA